MHLVRLDPERPDEGVLARAGEVLRGGGLVAFPTETVYGLGANALDAAAVERVFRAKGRPSRNPIIVHVSDAAQARALAAEWPPQAEALARHFWPGPLTLVLRRSPRVPDIVTAGGPTVGIRVPAHPVALGLLHAARVPIAAPSANPSNRVSPTRAEHVVEGLGEEVDMVLDGGPCPGGLESTVLDVGGAPARVLRPGLITAEQIEAVIGTIETGKFRSEASAPLPAPGLLPRHYAPRTALLVAEQGEKVALELARTGLRVGLLARQSVSGSGAIQVLQMPVDAAAYATRLYAALHEMDALDLDRIVVETPPPGPEWAAVRDRLERASTR